MNGGFALVKSPVSAWQGTLSPPERTHARRTYTVKTATPINILFDHGERE